MKILLFGKNGQVGWELNRTLQPLGEVVALGREEADFADPESLRSIVSSVNPDIIVNAAAYTAVDRAEQEQELAFRVNSASVDVLAQEAGKTNALFIHYSTDYVFDGTKASSYVEKDTPNPVNVYGQSKLSGEGVVRDSGCDYLIFRTSWVYASRRKNFLRTVLKLAGEQEQISIVADQYGSPTSARLVADVTALCTAQTIRQRSSGGFNSGIYNLTCSGSASWHGFAQEIVELAGAGINLMTNKENVRPIATSEYPVAAARPANTVLAVEKLEQAFSIVMPEWNSTLRLCIEEML